VLFREAQEHTQYLYFFSVITHDNTNYVLTYLGARRHVKSHLETKQDISCTWLTKAAYRLSCLANKYIYICIFSPYGFTLWDPRRLECLLQYEMKSAQHELIVVKLFYVLLKGIMVKLKY